MKTIAPAQRLIVAADYPVDALGRGGVTRRVRGLAQELRDTTCIIKCNSILRARGYNLIDEIRGLNLGFFADLKLIEIKEVLAIDGALLRAYNPDFLTAMGFAGVDALKRLRGEVSDSTKVLGVTVFTTFNDADTQRMFGCTVREGVLRFGSIIMEAGLDGFICAPAEGELLRKEFGDNMLIVSPGVRFAGESVLGDDQNPERVMTPGRALLSGVDYPIMGRPITQADVPYDAVMRAIHEMDGVPHYA